MLSRDSLASQTLGEIAVRTASDIRDIRIPSQSRVLTWLYANPKALLIVSEGPTLPLFADVEYLENFSVLLLKFEGQPHRLTAPPIVPNGIIEFPNNMAIAGPKKHMKVVSQFIRESGH